MSMTWNLFYSNPNRFLAKVSKHDNDCSLSSIDETTAMQDCPTAEPDSHTPEKSDVSKREVKPYKCIDCSKAFTLQNRLKTHERIHTGVNYASVRIVTRHLHDANVKRNTNAFTQESNHTSVHAVTRHPDCKVI